MLLHRIKKFAFIFGVMTVLVIALSLPAFASAPYDINYVIKDSNNQNTIPPLHSDDHPDMDCLVAYFVNNNLNYGYWIEVYLPSFAPVTYQLGIPTASGNSGQLWIIAFNRSSSNISLSVNDKGYYYIYAQDGSLYASGRTSMTGSNNIATMDRTQLHPTSPFWISDSIFSTTYGYYVPQNPTQFYVGDVWHNGLPNSGFDDTMSTPLDFDFTINGGSFDPSDPSVPPSYIVNGNGSITDGSTNYTFDYEADYSPIFEYKPNGATVPDLNIDDPNEDMFPEAEFDSDDLDDLGIMSGGSALTWFYARFDDLATGNVKILSLITSCLSLGFITLILNKRSI